MSLAGLDFRLRLLLIRARRFGVRLSLTTFAVATFCFAYPRLGTNARQWLDVMASSPTLIGKAQAVIHALGAASGSLGLIASAGAALIGGFRAVSAFGLKPGKLIAAVANTGRDESARLQAGARYRFAREFADFSNALDPRSLVIFIDDIDRCRPENVMEVLEAVNFLVTSGRCVVVLAMARPWVEACVGAAFGVLAKSDPDVSSGSSGPFVEAPSPGAADRDSTEQAQRRFARNYLEKMINIEIPVPHMTEEGSLNVLMQSTEMVSSDWKWKLGRRLVSVAPFVAAATVMCLVVGLALPASRGVEEVSAMLTAPISSTASRSQAPVNLPQASSPASRASLSPPPAPDQEAAFEAASAPIEGGFYWEAGLPTALGLAALAIAMLRTRKRLRVEDTESFRTALRIMQPWITLACRSPRSLKRFLNHLRYVAMRAHHAIEALTLWEQVKDRAVSWLEPSQVREAPETDAKLPEPVLVAFAAIFRCHETWLSEMSPLRPGAIEALLTRDFADRIPDTDERCRVAERLEAALRAFNESPELRSESTPLFHDSMRDHPSIVAFYRLMATETRSSRPSDTTEETMPSPMLRLHRSEALEGA